mmetsp:Transcript_6323/g.21175  ORF Transcript_6323/g.21175 Transcript_6323/m.21175 type:complete len:98 (-) Transcript_6323:9-302(-)
MNDLMLGLRVLVVHLLLGWPHGLEVPPSSGRALRNQPLVAHLSIDHSALVRRAHTLTQGSGERLNRRHSQSERPQRWNRLQRTQIASQGTLRGENET